MIDQLVVLASFSPWKLVFIATITLLTLRCGYNACKPPLRKVPGPFWARASRLWNVCNVWNGKVHLNFLAMHQNYGPIVRCGPNQVSISDPACIQDIYSVKSQLVKSMMYSTTDLPYEGEIVPSVFSTRDNALHALYKRTLSSAYSMSSIVKLESLVEPCTDLFISKMLAKAGTPVDLGEWVQWYAFDVIGEITFLKRFGFMEEERDINEMIRSINFGESFLGWVTQVPELHKLLLGSPWMIWISKTFEVIRKQNPALYVIKFVQDQIEQFDNDGRDSIRLDLLSYLREQKTKDNEPLPKKDLINHMTNNIFAGSDTTAITLRTIFHQVIKTPRVYERLVKEIDESVSGASTHFSYEEASKMPYLQAVIKEALRIHPAVGFQLERIAPKGGITLCRTYLPEGTILGMNAWVLHRDKEVFGDDVEVFRPERWLEAAGEELKMMNRSFFAFGHGSRICLGTEEILATNSANNIGRNIALFEITKFVPTVLRRFKIELVEKDRELKVTNYFFTKQRGLICTLMERAK